MYSLSVLDWAGKVFCGTASKLRSYVKGEINHLKITQPFVKTGHAFINIMKSQQEWLLVLSSGNVVSGVRMACIVIIVSSVCIVIASWSSINKKIKQKKQKKNEITTVSRFL